MIWISVDMGQAWKAFKLNYVGCFNIQDLTSDSLIAMTWTTLCHWTNLGFIGRTLTSVNLQGLIWTTLQYGTDIRMFHQSNLDLFKSACPNLNHSLLRNRHKDVSSVDPWLVDICVLQFEPLCVWNRHKVVFIRRALTSKHLYVTSWTTPCYGTDIRMFYQQSPD